MANIERAMSLAGRAEYLAHRVKQANALPLMQRANIAGELLEDMALLMGDMATEICANSNSAP